MKTRLTALFAIIMGTMCLKSLISRLLGKSVGRVIDSTLGAHL